MISQIVNPLLSGLIGYLGQIGRGEFLQDSSRARSIVHVDVIPIGGSRIFSQQMHIHRCQVHIHTYIHQILYTRVYFLAATHEAQRLIDNTYTLGRHCIIA